MLNRIIFLSLMMLMPLLSGATESVCAKIAEKAEKEKVRIPAHMSGRKVIGKNRAYFYTAPDKRCRSRNIFVVPNDGVQAYEDVQNFTYVTYWDARGNDVSGWMLNSRLTDTGTGIGPNDERL